MDFDIITLLGAGLSATVASTVAFRMTRRKVCLYLLRGVHLYLSDKVRSRGSARATAHPRRWQRSRSAWRSCGGTAGFLRLYDDRFLETRVCLPPLHEQRVIMDYLAKATADIDSASNRARRQIDLLREYRTRLIADVVTGKLDVREAAAQPLARAVLVIFKVMPLSWRTSSSTS